MTTFRNDGAPVVIIWTVKIKKRDVEQRHTISTGACITFDLEATNGSAIETMCRNAGMEQES